MNGGGHHAKECPDVQGTCGGARLRPLLPALPRARGCRCVAGGLRGTWASGCVLARWASSWAASTVAARACGWQQRGGCGSWGGPCRGCPPPCLPDPPHSGSRVEGWESAWGQAAAPPAVVEPWWGGRHMLEVRVAAPVRVLDAGSGSGHACQPLRERRCSCQSCCLLRLRIVCHDCRHPQQHVSPGDLCAHGCAPPQAPLRRVLNGIATWRLQQYIRSGSPCAGIC